MKNKIGIICRILLFILVLSCLLRAADIVLERKDSSYKYEDFFKLTKEDKIDVLFLGSSHVINDVNPVVLYRDYGYTAYNMGGHGSVLQSTYWELIEALNYCKPKLVVVDAYMLEKDVKYLDDRDAGDDEINTAIEQLHLNMDVWPADRLKLAALKDLIKEPEMRTQFLSKFSIYHSRWQELDKNDFAALVGKASKNNLLGSEMRYLVDCDPAVYPDPLEDQLLTEHTVGQEYLMKIIDECQRDNIDVLVTFLPCSAETKDKAAAVKAGEIAAAYDVPYLNLLNEDIIDLYTDLNDHGHLNITGSEKTTDYLGEYLKANYELTDHRGDAAYAYFDELAQKYLEDTKDQVTAQEDLYSKLNLLSLDGYSCVLYCNTGSFAFKDEYFKNLVKKLSGTDEIDLAGGPYILIKDRDTGIFEARDAENLGDIPTGLGTLSYEYVEEKYRYLSPAEDEETNYLYDDSHIDDDIQLILYDSESGEINEHYYFRSKGGHYEQ